MFLFDVSHSFIFLFFFFFNDTATTDIYTLSLHDALPINRAALDEAVAAGSAHFASVADVTDQAAVDAAIAVAAARQPIDILIANAGIAESAPFGRSDAALFMRMMDVN